MNEGVTVEGVERCKVPGKLSVDLIRDCFLLVATKANFAEKQLSNLFHYP
jgi:hypothetical protein